MQDVKNAFLAGMSSISPLFAAFETGTFINVVSAIGLPILLFTIGKTMDVIVQLYLHRRAERRRGRIE